MIPAIKEINFPEYATLSQATVNISDMGEKTITTQIKIDGSVVPDFSFDWIVEYEGERYIHSAREPQASKENTSMRTTIDLTFKHWAVVELQRYYFVEMASTEAGTVIPNEYNASLGLDLPGFINALNKVLNHWYKGKITAVLNPAWQSSSERTYVDINYSHVWDVLQKVYDYYGVRWTIESVKDSPDTCIIQFGYNAKESTHIFQYGYEGGLLKVERQVQNTDIRNVLIGYGGDRNLPYLYFKDYAKYGNSANSDNGAFKPDPDAIPELKDIPFTKLRSAEFRSYVQGWAAKHYGGTVSKAETYVPWAWEKGYTDGTFSPVDYVKDDESISKYGEHWGGLNDNDDIYPSIQGSGVDDIVAVDEILTDDVDASEAEAESVTANVNGTTLVYGDLVAYADRELSKTNIATFTVPDGMTGVLLPTGEPQPAAYRTNAVRVENDRISDAVKVDWSYSVHDASGSTVNPANIKPGTYSVDVTVKVTNALSSTIYNVTAVVAGFSLVSSTASNSDTKGATFDVWLKNIWGTSKQSDETDEQYAERVWLPILGTADERAQLIFTTGLLSVSSDYEFTIVRIPVYDTSKSYTGGQSHWRMTLGRSQAEYKATGKLIPNTKINAVPGDKFVFTGIELPHQYILWAEQKLHDWKQDNLLETAAIQPTWVVSVDKVRANNLLTQNADGEELPDELKETEKLVKQLKVGSLIRIADKRLTNDVPIELHVQSATYTWNEPSEGSPYIYPDMEVVLSDKVVVATNPVAQLQGDISSLQSFVGSLSNIQQIVKAVADRLYLRKDGIADLSNSPTRFANVVTGSQFRQGSIGGRDWGFYRDNNGNSVLETDRLIVRQDLTVNNLIINQATYVGGMQINSAAAIECTSVEILDDKGYKCYFDVKQGAVANLFKVDDVAFCQRWDSETTTLKFYKRRVIEVGEDYIVLTKGYKASEGSNDTGVNGSGVPEAKDNIIQYGNYTDKNRQDVIIRDVIGGGYERMLTGLDSVNASGEEYYFSGRQSSTGPRWFVGNKSDNEYAEYVNNILTISGRLTINSKIQNKDGSYTSIEDYFKDITDIGDLEDKANQAQQDAKDAKDRLDQWAEDGVISPPEKQGIKEEIARIDSDAELIRSGYDLYGLGTPSEYESAYNAYRDMLVALSQDEPETIPIPEGFEAAMEKYYSERTDALQAINNSAKKEIDGYSYLKKALEESTTISGGLVLTSLVQLGMTTDLGYKVFSGINGIVDTEKKGNGIAAWYGGPMKDGEADGWTDAAKSLYRFDGSGYLSGGAITWDAAGNGSVGRDTNGNPVISWDSRGVTLSDTIRLGTSDETLSSLINFMLKYDRMFELDTTSVPGKTVIKAKYDGFWSEGFISALGMNPNAGGEISGATTLGGLTNVASYVDNVPGSDRVLFQAAGSNVWTTKDLSEIGGGAGTIDETKLWGILGSSGSQQIDKSHLADALASSNVLSATKLAKAVTLWGQSFDGTQNVSGNMTGVNGIESSGNITVSNPTNSLAYILKGSQYSIGLHLGSGGTNRGIYDFTSSLNKWLLYFDASNTILNYGNVGIGTSSPSYKLHVAGATYISNSLTIGDATFTWVPASGSTPGYLKVNTGFVSDSFVSSLGLNPGGMSGGGGSSYDRLDNWGDYTTGRATDVLSAKLGYDLYTRVTSLESGSALNFTTSGSGNVVTAISKSGTTVTVTKGSTALEIVGYSYGSKSIPSGSDLNNYFEAGSYVIVDGNVLNTISNKPEGVSGNSRIISINNTGTNGINGYGWQDFYMGNSARRFSRWTSNGALGSWVEWVNSSNIESFVSKSYVKKSGDTMTGNLTVKHPGSGIYTAVIAENDAASVSLNASTNSGLYSNREQKWMFAVDANGTLFTSYDGIVKDLNADFLDGYHRSNLYDSVDSWYSAVGKTQSITVTGDANTYYPVVISVSNSKVAPTKISIWKNLGSTTPSISGNHTNGTSSMWLLYEGRSTMWDGNGGFFRTIYRSMPYANLVAHTENDTQNNGGLIIWLRGGTCQYNISCSNSFTVNIYYSTTNIGSSAYPRNVSPMTTTNNLGILNSTFTLYGNASSATKLAKTVTLWGQSFDGTANVSGTLYNVASIVANGTIYLQSSSASSGHYIMSNSDGLFAISKHNNQAWINTEFVIDSSGNVGIGTTPSYKLHVAGDAYVSSSVIVGRDKAISNIGVTILGASTYNDALLHIGKSGISSYGIGIDSNGYLTIGGCTSNYVFTISNEIAKFSSSRITFISPVYANSTLTIGGATFTWDSTNKAIKVDSNFYSTGAITALGVGSLTSTDAQVTNLTVSSKLTVSGSATVSSTLSVSGTVTIGTTATTYKLNVGGEAGATKWNTTSDSRLKTVLCPVNLTVEQIAAAPAVEFAWKSSGERSFGTLAQYWQSLNPLFASGKDVLSVQYGNLALMSVISVARRVSEHDREIAELKRENAEIRRENAELKKEVELLKAAA